MKIHHKRNERSKFGFYRLRKFKIEELKHLLGGEPYHFFIPSLNKFLRTPCAGNRIKTFNISGFNCVRCGVSGAFLAVEENNNGPVLNLYGFKNGKEILMTRDHIVPVSRGGKNENNTQTMCYDCNQEKANTYLV